jgi:threonine/homoserine/homoserine lactone efflux protein
VRRLFRKRHSDGLAMSLLMGVGAPLGGLTLIVGSSALAAFGPGFLATGWAASILQTIFSLTGYGLVIFTQLRYWNPLVIFGAFFLIFFGVWMLQDSVTEHAFRQRGETTTCAVRTPSTTTRSPAPTRGSRR